MSNKTKHYTKRQSAALLCQAQCIRQARLVDQHWKKAAPFFRRMNDERLYEELDFPNFSAWCESINVSPSHGYSLAKLDALPPETKNYLQVKKVGLGKIKLLLPHLQDKTSQEQIETIERCEDEDMTWHAARQELNGDDIITKWVVVKCPRCNKSLRASRAVTLEVD